ncbi:MAG: hypothetical protein ACD_20C00003G0014 [uncultured bacterium]|nr:MAG: hypothetical protein ACD_20C00003G0014 [uncultured bacterium]HBH19084.1 hypothetical protein [Cyanobacteria bacterium UBA9579]
MIGVAQFIISFCLVLSSSYFLASTIKSRRFENSILYLVLILVSQIIVSIEILSMTKQVTPSGLLFCNIIVFILSIYYWKHKQSPRIDFQEIRLIKDKIYQAVKKDKILLLLAIFFIFSSLISLLLTIIAPTNSADSMSYHLARIGFWIQNETLAHFETSSIRQIILPINSEILMLWSMVFFKKDYLSIFPQYLAYLGCIFTVFSYLRYLNISTRRILWTIFVFASLPVVILESVSAQTNLLVAFFLFTSLYLFVYGVKENSNKALVFSAIAFSINLGIKTTAFFFIPIFGIIYLLIAVREKKKLFYKPVAVFIMASIPAFLILSSYNYILNYLDFGNFLGTKFYVSRHSISISFKTFTANIIRYSLLFIDFTGIKAAESLTPYYLGIKNYLFNLFHLKSTDGLLFLDISKPNTLIHENVAKFGLLGFLILIPVMARYSFIKIISNRDKMFYISLTGLVTVGFIITISALMGFCIWNNRYLLSAVSISSTLFALSYQRKISIQKGFISLIVILNYAVMPVSNITKPFLQVCQTLFKYNFTEHRAETRLREEAVFSKRVLSYPVVKYLGKIAPDNSKIGLIFYDDELYYPFFEENSTWKLYPLRYELLKQRKNYDDYDFLVINGKNQNIEMINDKQITFDYSVKDNKPVFDKAKSPILYYDKSVKLVSSLSEQPVYLINMIDFSEIPINFKLVKKMDFILKDTNDNTKTRKRSYFIYRKIY